MFTSSDSSEKVSNSQKSIVEPKPENKLMPRPKPKVEKRKTEKKKNSEKTKKEEKEEKFVDTKSFHSELENNPEVIEHWNQEIILFRN